MNALPSHSAMLERVTAHAVIRYLERIDGLSLPPVDPAETRQEFARRCLELAGTRFFDIASLIMTPMVKAACLTGASYVQTSTFRALISSTGSIKTIMPPRAPKKTRRSDISRTEMHRIQRKEMRRNKRRPAEHYREDQL